MAKWTQEGELRGKLSQQELCDLFLEWGTLRGEHRNIMGAGIAMIQRRPSLFGDMKPKSVNEFFLRVTCDQKVKEAINEIRSLVPEQEPVPVNLGELRLPYADCLVLGDAQFPLHNPELYASALSMAQASGIKRLVWNGDTFDFAGLGKFADHLAARLDSTLDTVYQASRAALEAGFTEQVWVNGNHCARLQIVLSSQLLLADTIGTMLGRQAEPTDELKDTYTVTNRYYCLMEGFDGGPDWRFTHQKPYSRIRGRVAVRLADKYHNHIVSAHQHHLGITRSESGKFWAVDGGTISDPTATPYIYQRDDLFPEWTMGYVLLVDGVPEPIYKDAPAVWWAKRLGGEASCGPAFDPSILGSGGKS